MKSSANNSYKKSSFGPAFLFLSKRRRAALAAYYEFCRLMDDIADEPDVKDPLKELDFWQEEVARIFNQTPQTELGQELRRVVQDFGLPPDRFLLLIEGMRADVQHKTYDTLDGLGWYLYRVAVVVGLATLDILSVKGDVAEKLAQELGRAVQLTNIIRDVPDDAKLGRVYLPQELLTAHGLTRENILEGNLLDKRADLLRKMADVAQGYYEAAFQTMKSLPRLKRLPCRMMGCVYAKNLAKIRETGFLFRSPVKLTKTEKIRGVLYALFKTIFA